MFFFQRHRHRDLPADGLAETLPALVDDILFRVIRQFADETPLITQTECGGSLNADAVAQQGAVHR
jgi:hypothetical protein